MAKREVTVVINGEEHVSEATEKAGRSMGKFIGNMPDWVKGLAAIKIAYEGIKAVIGAVTAAIGMATTYVLESFAAYDRFAASQTKLAAQSKLTGVSLSELNRIADEGRDKFGLSAVTANEAATTVAKYASRAGDATKANTLLSAALDLGAASGLDAAASMEALEMGLRGQDEGFDKLLGKNPSSIWKEYADANGLAVGKMTDTQKRMAELTAIMDAGGKVTGSYSERLQSGAGAQDKLNQKLEEGKVAFGQAIQPARVFIVQGLTTLVEQGGRVVLAIGRVANAIAVIFTGAVELGRSVVGGFAVALGKLTGNKELEEWGRVQANAFSDFQAQLKKLEEKYLTTGKAAEESAKKQGDAVVKVGGDVKKTVETTEQEVARLNAAIDAKLGKPMMVAIGLTEGAITRLGQAATDQLPTAQSEKFLTHMQGLVTASGAARDKIMGIGQSTGTAATNSKDMAREVETLARGALDAAVSFGVIDDNAARSLNSAVNIASAVQKMATSGFSFAGAVGVIGGVASIVNTMMAGDAERRRLLRENNVSLARLSKDIGGLNLNVTGDDLAQAQGALGGLTFKGGFANFATDVQTLRGGLESSGLTMADLERIGNELGINIKDKNGNLSFEAIRQLQTALSTVKPGRLGSDFNSQLDFFKESQRIDGATGTGGINGLLDFLRNVGGVTALDGLNADDPQALRSALRNLFVRLNNGEGVGGLGKLTGSGFMQILTSLIDDLDSLGGTSGTGGGDITAPIGSGGGTVSAPSETIQAVIGAMNTNLGTILTAHTAIHERVAMATESSAGSLKSIDAKMDTLITVTEGQFVRIDKELASVRLSAATSSGAGPSF